MELDLILSLANRLYQQIDQANINKKQGARLAERVRILLSAIEGLETLDTPPMQAALAALKTTLSQAIELVSQFSQKKWVKRVLQAGNHDKRFKEINEQLSECSLQFNVGALSHLTKAREIDKADQAEDLAAIKAKQTEILEQNHAELKAAQSGQLSEEARDELLSQQMHAMSLHFNQMLSQAQANISESARQSPTSPVITDIAPLNRIEYFELTFDRVIESDSEATVYLGEWQGQQVAIKTHRGKLLPDERTSFIREVAIMARLRHPHIVPFYGAYLNDEIACLVRHYVPGGSLRQRLNNPLDWPSLKAISLGIIDGLSYLHGQKIIHRDLKSTTILLENTHAYLIDFELAKIHTQSIATSPSVSQSLAFQSPESLRRGAKLTEASDVYSVAMVLWEMVTREKPFEGETEGVIFQKIISGERPTFRDSCPDTIKQLIVQGWSTAPEARPSLKEMKERILAWSPEEAGRKLIEQGDAAMKGKQFEEAKTHYQSATQSGYTQAYSRLGLFYLKQEKEAPLALETFEAGIKAGDNRCLYNAGILLERGEEGIEPQPELAKSYYERAAEAGHEGASAALMRFSE